MKKYIIVSIIFLITGILSAQSQADKIIGYYHSIDPFTGEESQSEIYKASNGTYECKVCWVGNPEKKVYLNLVFLKNLKYNSEENEWQDGIVKYPGRKGTYKIYMKFESNTKLKVRGYWGIAMLGKTMYWTKENTKRKQN